MIISAFHHQTSSYLEFTNQEFRMNSNGVNTHWDHRKLIAVIPDDVKKTWNRWALPVLMITSITFQIFFMLGNRRRYHPKARHRIPLWHAYSFKNSVASTALGMITQTVLDSCRSIPKKNGLESLWASIFFYHLCDSNNITAYSLQDNDLWSRRLGELVFPLGLNVYIFFLSWPGCSHIPLLSILVHLASFIKCFERVQAQRLANTEHIRESVSSSAKPSPLPAVDHFQVSSKPPLAAYNLFQASKPLFLDLPCPVDNKNTKSFFSCQRTADEVFHVVDIALGFAYDLFYTNRGRLYTLKGQLFHAVDVLFFLLLVIGFYFVCDMGVFHTTHVAISCIAFALHVLKEIFAAITLFRSDWMDLFLIQHNLTRNILIFRFLKQPGKKRWSNSIAQVDFLSVVTEEMPAWFLPLQKYFGIDEYLEKHRYRSYREVSRLLKILIHEQFLHILANSLDPKDLYIQKGGFSLKNNRCDTLLWSINDVEFHDSILIWHIATTLNYHSRDGNQVEKPDSKQGSKLLSDYLLNLLVSKTEVLPQGLIGMIRYSEACTKAKDIILKSPIAGKASAACQKLLSFNWNEMPPTEHQCKSSVLFKGCKLALALRDMGEDKDMWQVTSEVWIEMLAYAAANCKGVHHSQHLRRGGEFLTHVWFLMVGFGIFN